MASVATIPAPLAASPTARRLQAEWDLLKAMVARNPQRLADPSAHDMTFQVTLRATPALAEACQPISTHRLRIVYPAYFPALPIECYLEHPVFHPNVHPETGFMCLWDRHLSSNTVEHALHKAAAMLGWRLFNLDARHVMQDPAGSLPPAQRDALAERLAAPALVGVQLPDGPPPPPAFRRRLS